MFPGSCFIYLFFGIEDCDSEMLVETIVGILAIKKPIKMLFYTYSTTHMYLFVEFVFLFEILSF